MELEQLIAECRAAVTDSAPTKAVRETVARAVSEASALEKVLGTPEQLEPSHWDLLMFVHWVMTLFTR